jgi:fructokinase
MIVVAGEALIDLIDEAGALRPHPGGGPFNTAMALGRLGVPVCFLGRLSNDRFGRLLATSLADSGVGDRYILRGAAPTPLALVHDTPDGDHEFAFYLAGTAYTDVDAADLPELDSDVLAVSVGTLALTTDPPAGAIEALLQRESHRRLIVLDPNVRPGAIGDRDVYRRRFERCAGASHVVKLSDADASWLYPGESLETIVDMILSWGARVVVLTLGVDGALARNRVDAAQVGSPAVDVADTVGAGDSFVAGLLRWLWVHDRLAAEAVGTLDRSELRAALTLAAAVGALQCARRGASPPTLAEVEAFLGAPT